MAEHNLLTTCIVVCTYSERRWDSLCSVIEALHNQTTEPTEIIIIVDHNPKLYERVRKQWSQLRVIENRYWRGAGGARNSSIPVIRADIVAYLDDDAVPAPEWLEVLCACYKNPETVGVGGAIVPNWSGKTPKWFPPEFHWVVGCTYLGMPTELTPVRNLIGANMSFRRDTLLHTGCFRKDLGRVDTLPVGCEETEYCIRIHQQQPNAVLLYQPAAVVRHFVPASRSRLRYFCSRCYFEGRSKARVSRIVGAQDGLNTERRYLTTLAKGILRGIGDTVRGDLSGLMRSGAIVLGLAITTIGYVNGIILDYAHRYQPVEAATNGNL
jgi:glycosyltransferase involved in cell wall biosynthesis